MGYAQNDVWWIQLWPGRIYFFMELFRFYTILISIYITHFTCYISQFDWENAADNSAWKLGENTLIVLLKLQEPGEEKQGLGPRNDFLIHFLYRVHSGQTHKAA